MDETQFWQALTRFAESGVLLPVALMIAVWLAVRARSARPALAWLLPLGAAIVMTTISKIAFLGFGIGIAALDFTGFSGHAMFAAAVYPMIAYGLSAQAQPSTRSLAVGAAYALALLIMVSRVKTGEHSASEALAGFALGAAASATALRWLSRAQRPALPLAAVLALFVWLSITPQGPVLLPSHSIVTRLALQLSGRAVPYTRADLHRGHVLISRKV
jgi:membrane-associated phospholipid phosphatase